MRIIIRIKMVMIKQINKKLNLSISIRKKSGV